MEPRRGLRGGHAKKTNAVKRGYVAGDPSPLRPFKNEHGRCLGHRPCCHRNQVVAAGDRC